MPVLGCQRHLSVPAEPRLRIQPDHADDLTEVRIWLRWSGRGDVTVNVKAQKEGIVGFVDLRLMGKVGHGVIGFSINKSANQQISQ